MQLREKHKIFQFRFAMNRLFPIKFAIHLFSFLMILLLDLDRASILIIAMAHGNRRLNRGSFEISIVRFKSATADSRAWRWLLNLCQFPSLNVFRAFDCFCISSKLDLNFANVCTTARPSLSKRFLNRLLFMMLLNKTAVNFLFEYSNGDWMYWIQFAIACLCVALLQPNTKFWVLNLRLYTRVYRLRKCVLLFVFCSKWNSIAIAENNQIL